MGSTNFTPPACAPPLLEESNYGFTGGHIPGRYCGVGVNQDGTRCCFPCPIGEWVYPPDWSSQLKVPNFLSTFSLVLCIFLLLSFAILPPEKSHRHYLSVGLLFPVLFISLSFVIPASTDPGLCFDDITPNDMHSSLSCAWTGAFVAIGGLGSVIWVFLRSLWLHIRIFWDHDPGEAFKCGSIAAGIILPAVFMTALLATTGVSYRMGQTCLPNHPHAIVSFWIWLVGFAIAGFILQSFTTGFCVLVYFRSLRREKERSVQGSLNKASTNEKVRTWQNVKYLLLLQWRNILVSVLAIIGSVSFFIVFWSQDAKLGAIFNDPHDIIPVKVWITCLTLSEGDKLECLQYVGNFTVSKTTMLTSLILASLVGIEIFILLARTSMFSAWRDLLSRAFRRHRIADPLLLTSLETSPSNLPSKPHPLTSITTSPPYPSPSPDTSAPATRSPTHARFRFLGPKSSTCPLPHADAAAGETTTSPTPPHAHISTPAPGSFTWLSSYGVGSEQTLRRAPSAGTRSSPGRGGLRMKDRKSVV